VRETLFNWLGQTLDGRRCLDLFAGSGALGFEAASRAAAHVDMVELSRPAYRALEENRRKLSCSNVALYCEDGIEFATRGRDGYDVIFLDPPYGSHLLPRALAAVSGLLAHDGRVYVESGAAFAPDADWEVLKRAKAGAVFYQLLARAQV
jgi:16S rRNA (guanine966-N2)-methyltransferase